MFVNTDPTKTQLVGRSVYLSNGTSHFVYDNPDTSSSWLWGRWILFTLVIFGIAFLVFWTNLRRRKRGVDPIVGTSWLAPPPSYGQSQRERYNPNNPQMTQQPLPVYTENANERNDLGYYDSEGKFVPTAVENPVGEGGGYPMTDHQQGASSSTTTTDATTTTTSPGIERPEAAATNTATYTRPAGPPPSHHT